MSPGSTFSYTWTPAQAPVARVTTSRTEMTHLLLAFAVLTFDIVLLLGGGSFFGRASGGPIAGLTVTVVVVSAAAVLTGFLCHELAHKVYAQRHGFWAEFRMSPFGLIISVVTAAIGFLWAAPGATVVSGMSYEDRANWGRTSLAGPVTNAFFGVAFYAGAVAAYVGHSALVPWLVLLAWFNGWFATFNLLPFGPLDGAKVLRWRPTVWAVAFVAFGAFTTVTFLLLYGVTNPLLGR